MGTNTYLEGTFALRGADRIAYDGGPAMDFLGEVRPINPRSCGRNVDCPDRLAWNVPHLIQLAPVDGPTPS